jgi:fumarate reductase subunit D
MASLEEEVLPHAQSFFTTVAIFAAITLVLWWSRIREARQLVNLRFDAEPAHLSLVSS